MGRNFYKGTVGDQVNLLLGAAAFNFKGMLQKYEEAFLALLGRNILWGRGNTPRTSVVHSVSK